MAVTAFHERDYTWIKMHCAPSMFEILCLKSDELCKSVIAPDRNFYPFIVVQPKGAEIITCVTDDPLRPHMMLRFSLQKTGEKIKRAPVFVRVSLCLTVLLQRRQKRRRKLRRRVAWHRTRTIRRSC